MGQNRVNHANFSNCQPIIQYASGDYQFTLDIFAYFTKSTFLYYTINSIFMFTYSFYIFEIFYLKFIFIKKE